MVILPLFDEMEGESNLSTLLYYLHVYETFGTSTCLHSVKEEFFNTLTPPVEIIF